MSATRENVSMDLSDLSSNSMESKNAAERLQRLQQLFALMPEDPMEIDEAKVSATEQKKRAEEAQLRAEQAALFKKVETQLHDLRKEKTAHIRQQKRQEALINPRPPIPFGI